MTTILITRPSLFDEEKISPIDYTFSLLKHITFLSGFKFLYVATKFAKCSEPLTKWNKYPPTAIYDYFFRICVTSRDILALIKLKKGAKKKELIQTIRILFKFCYNYCTFNRDHDKNICVVCQCNHPDYLYEDEFDRPLPEKCLYVGLLGGNPYDEKKYESKVERKVDSVYTEVAKLKSKLNKGKPKGKGKRNKNKNKNKNSVVAIHPTFIQYLKALLDPFRYAPPSLGFSGGNNIQSGTAFYNSGLVTTSTCCTLIMNPWAFANGNSYALAASPTGILKYFMNQIQGNSNAAMGANATGTGFAPTNLTSIVGSYFPSNAAAIRVCSGALKATGMTTLSSIPGLLYLAKMTLLPNSTTLDSMTPNSVLADPRFVRVPNKQNIVDGKVSWTPVDFSDLEFENDNASTIESNNEGISQALVLCFLNWPVGTAIYYDAIVNFEAGSYQSAGVGGSNLVGQGVSNVKSLEAVVSRDDIVRYSDAVAQVQKDTMNIGADSSTFQLNNAIQSAASIANGATDLLQAGKKMHNAYKSFFSTPHQKGNTPF